MTPKSGSQLAANDEILSTSKITPANDMMYRLPAWALDCVTIPLSQHVKQAEKHDVQVISEGVNTKFRQESTNEKSDRVSGFHISRDKYDEVLDLTASKFVPNGRGQLPACGSILLRSTTSSNHGQRFLDGVISHLAHDLQARVLTLDAPFIEELAWEFWHQDQTRAETAMPSETKPPADQDGAPQSEPEPELPDLNTFWGLIVHYFGVYGEKKGKRSKAIAERHNQAIAALFSLVAPGISQSLHGTVTDSFEYSPEDEMSSLAPLIVHFRDAERMLDLMEQRYRFWARLRDWVDVQRQNGRQCSLIVTLSGTKYTSSYAYGGLGKLRQKLRILDGNAICDIRIEPSHISPMIDFQSDNHGSYADRVNMQRLRRMLCQQASGLLDPDLVLLGPEGWMRKVREVYARTPNSSSPSGVATFETKIWSFESIHQLSAQLSGRAWARKTKITPNDIQTVLERVRRLEVARADEETSTADGISKSAWERKLDGIRPSLNTYEASLVENVVKPEEIESTYDDVILDDDIKDSLKLLLGLNNLRVDITSKFLSPSRQAKAAMLYGPPGTGKTHLARALAKMMTSSMLAVDSAALQSKYVGESEKYIQATFTLARKLAPCVVFIDEVDALFRRRSSEDHSWERSTITQFLQEMDGLKQDSKEEATSRPFILVATNRPMDLDDAFLRRLPQKFFVGLPDRAARTRILQLLLSKDDLEPVVEIETLADITEHYTGSDLRNLCAHAALIWTVQQERLARRNDEKKELVEATEATPPAVVKMQLNNDHFALALQRVRPSTTRQSLQDLKKFRDGLEGGVPLKREMQPQSMTIPELNEAEPGETSWESLVASKRVERLVLPIITPPAGCIQKSRTFPEYSPLPTSTSIRILRLEALDAAKLHGVHGIYERLQRGQLDMFEEIKCSMVTVDLQDATDYFALSYTWGNPSNIYCEASDIRPQAHWAAPAFDIECNGKLVSVGTNLYTALIGIRAILSYSSFSSSNLGISIPQEFDCSDNPTSLQLWVDALCINQQDIAEREQQVHLMDRVYSEARATFMWVGGEDPLATMATPLDKFMVGLGSEYVKDSLNFEDLITSITRGLAHISKSEWTGLMSILTRQYFQRAWVVQEWILSKANLLLCGLTIMNPSDIAKGVIMMHDLGIIQQISKWMDVRTVDSDGVYAPSPHPPAHRTKEVEEVLLPVYTAESSQIGISLSAMQSILIMKGYDIPPALRAKAPNRYVPANVTMDFQSFRGTRSTDPRDKLFAFLGLLKQIGKGVADIHVDYARPVQEVYTEAVRNMILASTSGGLNVLLWKEPSASLAGLPSWVPDFSTPYHGLTQGPMRFAASKGLDDYRVMFRPSPSGQDGYALQTTALRLDTIVATYDATNLMEFDRGLPKLLSYLPEKSIIKQPHVRAGELQYWWDVFFESDEHKPDENPVIISTTQSRFEVLWRTLLADTAMPEVLATEEYPCPEETGNVLRDELTRVLRHQFIRYTSRDLVKLDNLRREQKFGDIDDEENGANLQPDALHNYLEQYGNIPRDQGLMGSALTNRDAARLRARIVHMHAILNMLNGSIPFEFPLDAECLEPPTFLLDYEAMWADVQQEADTDVEQAYARFWGDTYNIIITCFNCGTNDAKGFSLINRSQGWTCRWWPMRGLFATSAGRLALAQERARIGDQIWLLPNLNVPLLLRPERFLSSSGAITSHYRVVGESYVHGIMHGQAVPLHAGVEQITII